MKSPVWVPPRRHFRWGQATGRCCRGKQSRQQDIPVVKITVQNLQSVQIRDNCRHLLLTRALINMA
jgi:hypothetical protein